MTDHVLSIVIAFLAYSMLDLGKAFQKVGLAAMSQDRGRGIGIWVAASTATSVSSFLILYAVSLGSVLIVGSMAGTGLAAVTLLTVLMMKQPVRRRELVGVVCIMAAPFLLASVYREPPTTRVVIVHLFYFLGSVVAAQALLLFSFRRKAKLLGILLATGAGTLGGFVILFQKISASDLGRAVSFFSHLGSKSGIFSGHPLLLHVLHVFTNPFALGWIVLSLLSTLVLQLAYGRGEAIRLIPSFNGAYILIPIIGGVLIFREPLHPLQWLGVLLILCGVALLSSGSVESSVSTSGAVPQENEEAALGHAGPRAREDDRERSG